MNDIIEQEKKYLVEVLGKKLIDSDERDDRRDRYQNLAKKYWPEEFKDGIRKEVHHIDFNHSNNVVSNLVVLTNSEHRIIHVLFDPNYEETRQKQSESMKGKNVGKHPSEETKQKMSEKRKGENNPFYGKHHTEESIQKMSEVKKGKHWKLVNGKRVWY